MKRSGSTITATVAFNYIYTTQIAGALGALSPSLANMASLDLQGTTGTQQTVGGYTDVQVLMDVSNSMTIATADKSSTLYNAVLGNPFWVVDSRNSVLHIPGWDANGCTFACRDTFMAPSHLAPANNAEGIQLGRNGNYTEANYDYYAMSRYLGVTLRIDLLKAAVTQIVQSMMVSSSAPRLRSSLSTFDDNERDVVNLGRASQDAVNQVAATDVTVYEEWRDGGPCCQTHLNESIASFANSILPAGNGLSQ